MIRPQLILDLNRELIVDNFAGGGGASTGIELALGRHVDLAINHDPLAVALHSANHPQTQHFCEDVFKVDPRKATNGRPVGLAWFSPDCKHFSKAKGGKPRSKKIRGLAWVVVKWAALVKPRVIVLENVEEFQDWGPLLKNGQPCPRRKGRTFKNFIARLVNLGYAVEWRELRACDYGAPTIRKRLFLIARCDGKPIVWPNPTHGDPNAEGFNRRKLKPWKVAADCIEWSLPCPSIFLSKEEARALGVKRPLAEATERRLARGVKKFVLESAEPFVVPLTHQGGDRVESISEPFRTITGAHRGEKALAVPFLTEHANSSTQRNFDPSEPLRTQCAEIKGGHFALVQSFLAKHYGGVVGSKLQTPIGTITSRDHHSLVTVSSRGRRGQKWLNKKAREAATKYGWQIGHIEAHYGQKGDEARSSSPAEPLKTVTASPRHALVVSHLSKFYGTNTGQRMNEPLHTVTSTGQHIAEVRAFLMKYYGTGDNTTDPRLPLPTVPTVDRFGLVQVDGQDYEISDIGMRMLVPRELYRAQGFPEHYIIDIYVEVERKGHLLRKAISQEAQVRMCGNSVCPPVAKAIVAANVPEMAVWRNGERKAFEKTLAKYCEAV